MTIVSSTLSICSRQKPSDKALFFNKKIFQHHSSNPNIQPLDPFGGQPSVLAASIPEMGKIELNFVLRPARIQSLDGVDHDNLLTAFERTIEDR